MTTTNDHTLQTADGPMRLYEAVPDGTPKGAVIVIMEAFGVNDHIEDVTRRAADAGYHAVAPDLFHRAGENAVAAYDDFGKVMEFFKKVDDDGVLVDVDATLEHLHSAGFADSDVGIVGFCFGGRVAFLVAARRAIGGSVTFYGGGIVSKSPLADPLIDEAKSLKTPWLGLFGDKDQGISVEDVEKLRGEVDAATVPHDIVRYDADHGFHCDGRPAVYDEAAAKDGWKRAIAWFDQHVAA
jgi:carboxymethylenebutenolidase